MWTGPSTSSSVTSRRRPGPATCWTSRRSCAPRTCASNRAWIWLPSCAAWCRSRDYERPHEGGCTVKTPKSLLETSEGCPSPFTRLAEGRRDPALISFSTSAQSGFASACQHAASLRSAALSHQEVVPNSFHKRRIQPPQELVSVRCTAGSERHEAC